MGDATGLVNVSRRKEKFCFEFTEMLEPTALLQPFPSTRGPRRLSAIEIQNIEIMEVEESMKKRPRVGEKDSGALLPALPQLHDPFHFSASAAPSLPYPRSSPIQKYILAITLIDHSKNHH